jgi:hypothetical protein
MSYDVIPTRQVHDGAIIDVRVDAVEMPASNHRPRSRASCRARLPISFVMALALLAACSSRVETSGSQSPGFGLTSTMSSPASSGYDLIVYLCVAHSAPPCNGHRATATATETSAIAKRLRADPSVVVSVRDRSQKDQYHAATSRLPRREAKLLRSSDVPAVFIVVARDAQDVPAVTARCQHLAGVARIKPSIATC